MEILFVIYTAIWFNLFYVFSFDFNICTQTSGKLREILASFLL